MLLEQAEPFGEELKDERGALVKHREALLDTEKSELARLSASSDFAEVDAALVERKTHASELESDYEGLVAHHAKLVDEAKRELVVLKAVEDPREVDEGEPFAADERHSRPRPRPCCTLRPGHT